MSRRTLIIAGVLAAAIASCIAAVVLLPAALEPDAAIGSAAIGTWQETDSPRAYELTVARDEASTGRTWYTVTYPRSFKVPFPASLDGGRIVIWGENAISDPVWYLTYDEESRTLTATRPGGGEAHAFRRVAP